MITVIVEEEIIETGYYKCPVFHKIYKEDNLICSIRKANIEHIKENISSDGEIIEDEFLNFKNK